MKNTENLNFLFDRFLSGAITGEELQQLFDHFNTADEIQLRALIQSELETDQQWIDQKNDRKLKFRQLYQGISNRIDVVEEKSKFRFVRTRYFAASVVAVLVLFGGYYFLNRPGNTELQTATTAYGNLRKIYLPDSSIAWLNAGTVISYPNGFKGSTRTVILKNGNVFFDVKHNARKPFIVKTNELQVVVLGTSFEVSAFKQDSETKVSVTTGKVGVQLINSVKPAIFLLPGERAVITNASHAIHIETKAVNDIAVWREQRLIFEDQPLSEVMQSLERKYNVHIEIQNDQLLSEKISMRLNNQPLKDILTAISFANHFNYEIINDQLIVIK